jgi:hypothetical protein
MTSSASAATKTSNPEELPAPSGIKRRNSRFLLEETKETKKDDKDSVMYRPEFSGVKTTVENEKIWELMSSYMGSDKKSI